MAAISNKNEKDKKMKRKVLKRFFATLLAICICCNSSLAAFAATDETYLSDLRLIYAEDYAEAKEILSTNKL